MKFTRNSAKHEIVITLDDEEQAVDRLHPVEDRLESWFGDRVRDERIASMALVDSTVAINARADEREATRPITEEELI